MLYRGVSPRLLVLGLGSNVGPSEAILRWATEELGRFCGPLRVAPLYRSTPVAPVAQPDFLNTVVVSSPPAGAGPEEVLAFAKALELSAGRCRGVRFAPRPLDVDLLLLGGERRQLPELVVPHPRLRVRRFVLAPLADLVPELALPPDGETVAKCLRGLGEGQHVERLEWTS